MSCLVLGRWIAVFSLSLSVAAACDGAAPPSPSRPSIDGNWQGQLSDTVYLLVIRLSSTGQASGQGVETRPGTVGSLFDITGSYAEPSFLLHFSGPTYPADFVGTLRPDDAMVGEIRVSEPGGPRTRAGVTFSRLPVP